MESLLGFLGLLAAAVVAAVLAFRHAEIRVALLLAFVLRAGAALFHYYVAPLPDGAADALRFEALAWEWGERGFLVALTYFPGPNTFFNSWLIALLYGLTDRSPLMAQSLSVMAGTAAVFFGWKFTYLLWGSAAARRAIWVLALFPTLILYSALVLREAFVVMFFLIGMNGVVIWGRSGRFADIPLPLLGFAGAVFFHGAFVVCAIAFLMLVVSRSMRRSVRALQRAALHPASLALVLLASASLAILVVTEIKIPKLGTIEDAVNPQRLMSIVNYSARDGAAYPDWTRPETPLDLVLKAPFRMAYFMFAPFPWDVQKPAHIIGLLDGLLYCILIFWIWRNRKNILNDPGAYAALLVFVSVVIAFSMAIGNFGTGLRHRAKFVAVLIALAAKVMPGVTIGRLRSVRSSQSASSVQG